jgi:hypothetical protein
MIVGIVHILPGARQTPPASTLSLAALLCDGLDHAHHPKAARIVNHKSSHYLASFCAPNASSEWKDKQKQRRSLGPAPSREFEGAQSQGHLAAHPGARPLPISRHRTTLASRSTAFPHGF